MSVFSLWSKIKVWSEEFIRKLLEKEYRDEYLADQVRTGIAFQIRALREQKGREWNQTQLGERMSKPQSVVSRLEDPDYGKVTLQTLLNVATAFDVALLVQFVEWDDWLSRMDDVSPESPQKESFDANKLRFLSPQQFFTPGNIWVVRSHNFAISILIVSMKSQPNLTESSLHQIGRVSDQLTALGGEPDIIVPDIYGIHMTELLEVEHGR